MRNRTFVKGGNMQDIDAALILSEYISESGYSNIPEQVISRTKESILDTLGIMIGGTGTDPRCRDIIELVKEAGGKEESSILVFGGKVPAFMAAFANGTMTHILNYADVLPGHALHPTPVTLPAALATAEMLGNITGKEFITAVAMGVELSIRMALAVKQSKAGYTYDWHMTPLVGTFSSAAAAGKLLKLDKNKLADTLGIALHQAAGTLQMNWSEDVGICYFHHCFPAKAGVLSALLARRGVTGIKDSFESRAGFYNVYFKGIYDRSFLVDNIGSEFGATYISYKPFPVSAAVSSYISAALEYVRENDVDPEDIVQITVFYYDNYSKTICEPIEYKRKPPDFMAASLSVPFVVAQAIANKKVTIDSFAPEALKDQRVLKLTEKTIAKYAPEFSEVRAIEGARPGVIAVTTKDGETKTRRVDFAPGHPKNPMAIGDLIAKFKDCVAHAARPIPEANVEKAIDMILKLEDVDNVNQLVNLLT